MLVLFESWLPSDRLESLWKGTRSAGFDGQPRHLFTDMVILFRGWLRAPLCGKGKITLWWCALIWRYESIRLLLCRTFACDSGPSLQTHLQPARPLHLPSLKLSINTEEDPRIWLPHINRCTTTQTHSQTQTVLQSACVNKVLPTRRPICLISFSSFIVLELMYYIFIECFTANTLSVINRSFIWSHRKLGFLFVDLFHRRQPMGK